MGRLFGQDRRSLPLTFPEPPVPAFLGADPWTGAVGAVSTPEQALAVPTVWQCTSLLANAVSMMPLRTYRRTAGVPAPITDPPLIVSPSAGLTQSEWLHSVVVSCCLRGNAYGIKGGLDSMLRPTQIELLHPDRVQVSVDPDTGSVVYRVRGNVVDPSTVWHMRGMTMPGSKVGLSPVGYAAAALGLDISSRQFASDFFASGGVPKAILTSDSAISQDTATTLKERFLGASRRREPVVLGSGATYQQVQVAPEESQFLATQQASVSQIARYFGIPPKMIGGSDGNSMTYANVEQLSLDFLTYAVSFWLKRIEDSLFPLLPQPQYVRFDTSSLLRNDAQTQATVDVVQIAAKIRTRDEIRARDGLAPLTAEQLATLDDVPGLTITPKGGAKAVPAPPAPEPTPEPTPAADQQGADSAH